MDRAVRAAERHGLPGPVDRWRALRARIRAEVCRRGYDPNRNTFTRAYGSSEVDSELLLLPAVGFLPWQDARIRGTVEAVRAASPYGVNDQPEAADASPLNGFWLADALSGTGRHREATALFERLLALRNDIGILADGYDLTYGRRAGRTPHTASLIALVNTARRLANQPRPR